MTIQEIYNYSESYKEFKNETGLTEEDATKYWAEFSNNPGALLKDLKSTMEMIDELKSKSGSNFKIYASDDHGYLWYFACTGRTKKTGKYFSITFSKRETDEITVREAHCSDISLVEILAI